MKIHEFEAEERLCEIKLHFFQVSQIKKSLSEHREKYRNLSLETEIEQDSLMNCCDFFERSLLINCYTFSEQIVKNFIYAILEKGSHSNSFLNRFIDNKIPEDRFSPNASYEAIQKLVGLELHKGYKFSLSKNRNCFRVYDEMIKSRHKYAHKGSYEFDFKNFELVIQTLELLYIELKMPLEKGMNYREEYQKIIEEIKQLTENIDTNYQKNKNLKFNNRVYGENLDKLKIKCKYFNENYLDSLSSICFLNPILEKISDIGDSDLRSKQVFVEKVIDLKKIMINNI